MTPAISILIPYWNKADFIHQTVSSVIVQTFTNWEIVLVDDGSTDESSSVLNSLLRKYPRLLIQVLRIPHTGCAGATDVATKYATAPLCTILDADDMLLPHSLQTVVDFFKSNQQVVYAWTKYECRASERVAWRNGRSKDLPVNMNLKQALLSGWWGALAQRSFRRQTYLETGGLDHSLPFAVDQQLGMLFAQTGKPTAHIPVVTYRHWQHDKQMSATNHREQQRCRGEILKRLGGRYVRER